MSVSEAAQIPKPEGRDHILVIDDDPLFRSLMVTILRREYSVSVASDGSEGFYLALERKPSLVTIDVLIPGWDGLRTLQAFRSHPLLQSVPAILLTSDASRETVMAAIHAGADEYIVKTSFNREILQEKIRRLITRGVPHPLPESQAAAAPTAIQPELPSQPMAAPEADAVRIEDDDSRLQAVLDGWD